jgi:hypothetical protein
LKAEKSTKEVALTRKIYTGIAVALALLVLVMPSSAGRQSGTLKGKITDNQGFPLSGAYIYVTSPSLLGTYNFITSESGHYGLPDLAPGIYRIMVEMPGFKTVNVEGIVLAAGATALLNFKMEPSEIEDEIVSREPVQGPDKVSARLAAVLDRDLLTHIPMPRDFSAVLGLVPGAVTENNAPGVSASIHGAPATANAFIEDGVNVTDPLSRTPMSRINVDLIDQVVVETAGLAADRDPGQGAYLNVIRLSGANDFDGSLAFFYTGPGFSKSLWSDAEIGSNNPAAPRVDRSNLDTSFTAGGPLTHDLGWFFSNFRLRTRSQATPFRNFKDPLNVLHNPYNWRDTDLSGTFKLSARVTRQFKGLAEVSFSRVNEPVYEPDIGWNRPEESTRRLDGQTFFLGRAGVVYTMDQRTLLDFSLGYMNQRQSLLLNDAGLTKASYVDSWTGYVWGSGPFNDREGRKRLRANMTITRLQDRALGAAHELVAGAEYETGKGESTVWKYDNLVMDYYDSSPYTFGYAVSPGSGNTVGLGRIGFSVIPGGTAGAMTITRDLKRVGAFAQDTLTFGGRVALSLGLRFDRSSTQILAISKAAVGNSVALGIGDSLITPVYGFNPFNAGVIGRWDNMIIWSSLSPRFGLSVDLLGTGKTLLRGTYSRLPEDLSLGYTRDLDPVSIDRIHNFYWYDENGDGKVDAGDTYVAFPENYNAYGSIFTMRLDPGLRAPMVDEWTVGLDHELMRDFSLSARYISRSEKGVIGDVMYDPATDRPWYTVQDSPAGWWVPFNTTVPESAAYPETNVTVYLRSTTAPAVFDRIQEVPELSRKYRGLEFSFRKRMSHNWQLFGSIVWSRSTGTAGLASPLSAGIASPVLTPNAFINVPLNSRTDMDRPLAIRVMGTVRFKYDIYLSAYYRYISGAPWARSVTITPPAVWSQEHGADATPVTVFLESPGTRRHGSWQSTDVRLEKEFRRRGKTRWSVYLDALNLFGDKYRVIDYNDGFWYPDGEGASSGTHVLSGTYGRAIFLAGTRTFAFSVKLGF